MTALPPLRLQLHWIVNHPCALLNRDDHGNPKGLTLGGTRRHRATDAAQKSAWKRATTHTHALTRDLPVSTGSQILLRRRIGEPLVAEGYAPQAVAAAAKPFVTALTGRKSGKVALKNPGKNGAKTDDEDDPDTGTDPLKALERREGVRLGPREVAEIDRRVRVALETGAGDIEATRKAADSAVDAARENLRAMADAAGADAALLGRHTTGDLVARMDSALTLANLFTTHEAQTETCFRTQVDELQGIAELGHAGAMNLNEPRLAGGVFYGHWSLDITTLLTNTTGFSGAALATADRTVAAELAARLVMLTATVGPTARLTQNASSTCADLLVLEIGTAPGCNLGRAFTETCEPTVSAAIQRLEQHIARQDAAYGRQWLRAVTSIPDCTIPGAERMPLADLAETARHAVLEIDQVAPAVPAPQGTPRRLWAA